MNGVTRTCQMESTKLNDGRTVNVIDTPGLFDCSVGPAEIGKEIVECLNLAKDGVHAFIMVFSVRSRFSKEEESILKRLQIFFGERIVDYMILVFTGGDDLDDKDGRAFREYLSGVPTTVQSIIDLCKNRVLIFDNKRKDKNKKSGQVQKLLSCVNSVIANNEGKPFSNEIFQELKIALKDEIYNSHDYNPLAPILKKVEERVSSMIGKLEKELEEEKAAQKEAQLKSDNEICKLKNENEELKKQLAERSCVIL